MRKGYVYILANKPYGTLYIGVTSDLSARLEQHRRGIASAFTKKYGVTRLVLLRGPRLDDLGNSARKQSQTMEA